MSTMSTIEAKKSRLPLVDRKPGEDYFPDTGCAVSPSCLRCPLARCIYDEPEEDRRQAQQERDREIFRLYLENVAKGALLTGQASSPGRGPAIRALAERFGVSRRTVHRAVQRMRQRAARNGEQGTTREGV